MTPKRSLLMTVPWNEENAAHLMRRAGFGVRSSGVEKALTRLGQSIFDPPSVFGWDEGLAWLSSNGVVGRLRVAEQIADARADWDSPYKWSLKKLAGKKKTWDEQSAAEVVSTVVSRLGLRQPDPASFTLLESYLKKDSSGAEGEFALNEDVVDEKVRGLVALVLSSADHQFAESTPGATS